MEVFTFRVLLVHVYNSICEVMWSSCAAINDSDICYHSNSQCDDVVRGRQRRAEQEVTRRTPTVVRSTGIQTMPRISQLRQLRIQITDNSAIAGLDRHVLSEYCMNLVGQPKITTKRVADVLQYAAAWNCALNYENVTAVLNIIVVVMHALRTVS